VQGKQTKRSAGRVALKGDATIAAASDIHAQLTDALHDGVAVTVDISGVERVDLSFVQLLIAATRSARRSGAELSISGNADMLVRATGGSRDLDALLDLSGGSPADRRG